MQHSRICPVLRTQSYSVKTPSSCTRTAHPHGELGQTQRQGEFQKALVSTQAPGCRLLNSSPPFLQMASRSTQPNKEAATVLTFSLAKGFWTQHCPRRLQSEERLLPLVIVYYSGSSCWPRNRTILLQSTNAKNSVDQTLWIRTK